MFLYCLNVVIIFISTGVGFDLSGLLFGFAPGYAHPLINSFHKNIFVAHLTV